MRTTLEIDDDILSIAKELARDADKTAGKIISELARKAITAVPMYSGKEPEPMLGIRPFPKRGGVVTNEQINKIRDEEGI